MLKFDLTLFNDNTEGERYSDMSAVDIKVGVVLGQIRVVFVNKFVTDMLVRKFNFILKITCSGIITGLYEMIFLKQEIKTHPGA